MKDNQHKQPKAEHIKHVGLEPDKKEKQDFNHVEYAKVIAKQLKDKKKKAWQDVSGKKDEDKRPLLVANKEQLDDRKKNPKGHKGRIN